MAYKVILTPQAAHDADTATDYIAQFAPAAASRWFAGLVGAVNSLAEMPQRCPYAPESAELGLEIRQLLYGRRTGVYRILFRIYESESGQSMVRVIAIRHGARRPLELGDLDSSEWPEDQGA